MELFTPQNYAATAATVRQARADVTALLAGHVDTDDLDIAILCTSELAQNAIRHGDHTVYTVTVEQRADIYRITVANTGDGGRIPDDFPSTFADLDAESGRGMALVRTLAPARGHAIDNTGVTIWIDVPAADLIAA